MTQSLREPLRRSPAQSFKQVLLPGPLLLLAGPARALKQEARPREQYLSNDWARERLNGSLND
eukprot:7462962-Alexandrium_andersonii.AAC.1